MADQAQITELEGRIGEWTPKDGGDPIPKWGIRWRSKTAEGKGNIVAKKAPSVGESITVEDKGGWWKCSRPKTQGAGATSDGERQRSIVRQSCLKVAADLTGTAATLGLLKNVKGISQLTDVTIRVADLLVENVEGQKPASDVPVDWPEVPIPSVTAEELPF